MEKKTLLTVDVKVIDYEEVKALLLKQADKIETLEKQLDAKIVLINNGWEEERYALQEEVIQLQKDKEALARIISADVKRKKMRRKGDCENGGLS